MVQSVELLLDDAADEAVREQWRLLRDADLASQARHRSPTNRPHVTLAAVPLVTPQGEDAVARSCAKSLPLPAYLGPLAVFGRDPVVLVRLVVATAPLLALHAAVARAVGVADDGQSAVGRWVPHVTLAHRMPLAQLSRALTLLPAADLPVRFDRARRWDGDRRRSWAVEPGASGGGAGGP